MNFFNGFADELMKTAGRNGRFGGVLKALRMGKSTGHAAKDVRSGMGLARGAAIAGGAGGLGALGGELFGKKKGKEKGYEEGTSDVEEVAQRARNLGRQEGVLAYHQALQARLAAQSK